MISRGSLVTVALQGDSGKPCPALVIQGDLFESLRTLVVLPITSTLREAPLLRVAITPAPSNGLREPSQIAIDRPQPVRREKIGARIGAVDEETMLAVNRALAMFLGLA